MTYRLIKLLPLLGLAGCGDILYPETVEPAKEQCAKYEGLKYADIMTSGNRAKIEAYCQDGTIVTRTIAIK